MKEIILASGSPRRKELLSLIGVPYKVMKSDAPEVVTQTAPEQIVQELALLKARWVMERLSEEDAGKTVLGADTIVWMPEPVSETEEGQGAAGGRVLGKPSDRDDARRMLRSLQGRSHSVFTGVALLRGVDADMQCVTLYRETKVHVHAMTDAEIEAYLDTGDPFDKAGAYGIQGPFAAYVDAIEGDYPNVVGLPVAAVYQALKKWTHPAVL